MFTLSAARRAHNDARGPSSRSWNQPDTLLKNTTLLRYGQATAPTITADRDEMAALVGYASSDEDDDIPPEKPAEVGGCYYSRIEKARILTNQNVH